MKEIMGWWFCKENKLPHGDNRKIKLGKTHKITGKIVPCKHGLHLSTKIIDALKYSQGGIIYKVKGHGTVIPHGNPIDKYVCSKRTYIDGGINIEQTLRKFARLCALDVVHLWDALDVVIKYLISGKEELRPMAWAAAGTAAWAAARAAARDTAWDAARDAAFATARKKQNNRLRKMVNRQLRR